MTYINYCLNKTHFELVSIDSQTRLNKIKLVYVLKYTAGIFTCTASIFIIYLLLKNRKVALEIIRIIYDFWSSEDSYFHPWWLRLWPVTDPLNL